MDIQCVYAFVFPKAIFSLIRKTVHGQRQKCVCKKEQLNDCHLVLVISRLHKQDFVKHSCQSHPWKIPKANSNSITEKGQLWSISITENNTACVTILCHRPEQDSTVCLVWLGKENHFNMWRELVCVLVNRLWSVAWTKVGPNMRFKVALNDLVCNTNYQHFSSIVMRRRLGMCRYYLWEWT